MERVREISTNSILVRSFSGRGNSSHVWVALSNLSGSQFLIGMVYGVVMAIVVSLLPCAVSLLQGERVCS